MCPNFDNTELSWPERLKEKGGWLWDVPEAERGEAEILHDTWLRTATMAEKEWKSGKRELKKKIDEWIQSDESLIKFKKRARLRYLKEQLAQAWKLWYFLRDKRIAFERAIAPARVLEEVEAEAEKVDKKIKGYEASIRLESGRMTESDKKELITDEMIERAREYPIENLIEVGRNGRAKCIFHQGEDYNMDIRQNFAYCYVCGESGDPIKIYKTIHGVSFREAVLALQ